MNHVRKSFWTVGGIFLAASLIVALAPKVARGVAAALVEVANTRSTPVPVETVRRSASNFITLNTGGSLSSPGTTWTQLNPDGSVTALPYALPPGEQLVLTDITVNAVCFGGSCPPAGTQVSVVMPSNEGFGLAGPFFYSTSLNYQFTEGSNLFAVQTDYLRAALCSLPCPTRSSTSILATTPAKAFPSVEGSPPSGS